ncbi:MAG TPA: hypothetical protein VFO76_07100, partial [Candidatus Kapabacteria bacterium]|nr:hypothetical protein [Candidatus Kapabacteria bacterium]
VQLKNIIDMSEKEGLMLEITDAAKDWLAQSGYDPVYGARPLKRVIQKQIVDTLALKVLGGDFRPGDRIVIDHTETGQYTFTKK